MKLKARGKEPVSVCLLSGHCKVIPPEGIDVPSMFLDEAFRMGCLPVEVPTEEVGKKESTRTDLARKEIISNVIKAMLERGDELTGAGLPNLKVLSKDAGFTVEREEMVDVFNELAEEAGLGESKGS